MHGADIWAAGHGAAGAGQASRRRASEFREERVEDPDVVLRVREDVDVHFLEHVEGQADVVLELEGEGAREAGEGGGFVGGLGRLEAAVDVGEVEVAPDVFDLLQVERVAAAGLG